MQRRLELKISGRVQGVGFRWAAREKATEFGLTLRRAENIPDGRVLLVAEGEKGCLQKFLDWVKVGPESARVERVEVQDASA